MNKKQKEPQTEPGKCAVCSKCRIYTEGPMKGHCIYGGPFSGYIQVIDKDQNGKQTTELLGIANTGNISNC